MNFGNFRDTGHPITTARIYDSQGADELMLLDIEATKEGRRPFFGIIRDAADQCFMPLTAGGGVRKVEDIREFLLSGAEKVAINTAAVEDPSLVKESAYAFGSSTIVVSIDARKADGKREVFVKSGTKPTGLDPLEWAREAAKLGAGELVVTSIDHEGRREGYDIELTRMIADAVDVPVIASGGAGTLQHFVDGIVEGHASAVSAGSIFHFTDQSIIKAKAYMKNAGLDVRTFNWW